MTVAKRRARPAQRTEADRLHTVEAIIAMLGKDIVRLIERLPKAERLQAELAATREHLAVQSAACRRLLGEKDALIAYTRQLEERLNGFERQVTDGPIRAKA